MSFKIFSDNKIIVNWSNLIYAPAVLLLNARLYNVPFIKCSSRRDSLTHSWLVALERGMHGEVRVRRRSLLPKTRQVDLSCLL